MSSSPDRADPRLRFIRERQFPEFEQQLVVRRHSSSLIAATRIEEVDLGAPHVGVRWDFTTGRTEEMLLQGTLQEPKDVSPDGKFLVFSERTARGEYDLWTLALAGSRVRSPLIQAPSRVGRRPPSTIQSP